MTPDRATLEARRRAVEKAAGDTAFPRLIEIAGLNPARHLRFANWSGIDMSGCDLDGFDFTGANLAGCRFEGARIAGARFDAAIVERAALRAARDWDAHAARWRRQEAVPSGRHLPDLAVFSDAPFAPEMVAIPPGSFLMGASPEEHDRFGIQDELWAAWERPQRTVRIASGFALARHPLTFDEYDPFCEATGRARPDDRGWGRGSRPVINVEWTNASEYCDWLGEQTGARYRLPSEAEWEYACRAGTRTAYWWGEDWDGSMANGARDAQETSEVGTYRSNPWGLFDTSGNVWEWCTDVFQSDSVMTPSDGSPHLPQPVPGDARRVVRGGSWYFNPRYLRSAGRSWDEPEGRGNYLGFRPARTLLTP